MRNIAINIRFGDYTGQDSLRSERQVTVTGDREERRSDLQRIIDDYPAVEQEQRLRNVLENFQYKPIELYEFKSPIDFSNFDVSSLIKLRQDEEN